LNVVVSSYNTEGAQAAKRNGGHTHDQVGELLPKGQIGVNAHPELFGGNIASRCWYGLCKVSFSEDK